MVSLDTFVLAPAVIKTAVLIFFGLVQIFGLIMLIIIRYHFKNFTMPADRRAQLMMQILTVGFFIVFIIAAFLLAITLA